MSITTLCLVTAAALSAPARRSLGTIETQFDRVYSIAVPNRERHALSTMAFFGVHRGQLVPAVLKQQAAAARPEIAAGLTPDSHTATAVGPADADVATLGRLRTLGPGGQVNDGELACSLSHAATLRRFLESGAESALIFEDDVKQESPEHTTARLDSTMANTPADWEFVNFGRCWDECDADVAVAPGVVIPTRPMCTHAYAVSRTGAVKLLDSCFGPNSLEVTLDRCYATLVRNGALAAYAPASPALFWQDRKTFGSRLGSANEYRECDYAGSEPAPRAARSNSQSTSMLVRPPIVVGSTDATTKQSTTTRATSTTTRAASTATTKLAGRGGDGDDKRDGCVDSELRCTAPWFASRQESYCRNMWWAARCSQSCGGCSGDVPVVAKDTTRATSRGTAETKATTTTKTTATTKMLIYTTTDAELGCVDTSTICSKPWFIRSKLLFCSWGLGRGCKRTCGTCTPPAASTMVPPVVVVNRPKIPEDARGEVRPRRLASRPQGAGRPSFVVVRPSRGPDPSTTVTVEGTSTTSTKVTVQVPIRTTTKTSSSCADKNSWCGASWFVRQKSLFCRLGWQSRCPKACGMCSA